MTTIAAYFTSHEYEMNQVSLSLPRTPWSVLAQPITQPILLKHVDTTKFTATVQQERNNSS